jgi:hypothetical protein
MLMLFQRFYQGGEKRHEPFGADAIGGMPGQEQRVLDFWPVMVWPWALRGRLLDLRMVEQLHYVLAIVASDCHKVIQQSALLLDRCCLAILREQVLK